MTTRTTTNYQNLAVGLFRNGWLWVVDNLRTSGGQFSVCPPDHDPDAVAPDATTST